MHRLPFGQITNCSENSNGSVPVGQSEFTLENWVQVQKHCWTFVTKFIKQTHSWWACFPYLIKKWPTFVEPKASLLCSQQPAIGPYPEPDESILHPPYILQISYNIILSVTSGSSKWPLSFRFSHPKPSMHFSSFPWLCASCPAHHIFHGLITVIMFCEGTNCEAVGCVISVW
jgi:hypothetical protein